MVYQRSKMFSELRKTICRPFVFRGNEEIILVLISGSGPFHTTCEEKISQLTLRPKRQQKAGKKFHQTMKMKPLKSHY